MKDSVAIQSRWLVEHLSDVIVLVCLVSILLVAYIIYRSFISRRKKLPVFQEPPKSRTVLPPISDKAISIDGTQKRNKFVGKENEVVRLNLRPVTKVIQVADKNSTQTPDRDGPNKDFVKPNTQLKIGNSEKNESTIKFVGYVPPTKKWQEGQYPIWKFPKQNCVIQDPRKYKRNLRGYCEVKFEQLLRKYLADEFDVSGEHSVATGDSTRPYEPDITVISRKGNHNFYVDIEIDEPYAAIKRNPMHCIGSDVDRDCFFTARGWIVLRFTERQVHLYGIQCVYQLAIMIFFCNREFKIPPELQSQVLHEYDKQWNMLKAQVWERERYREKYLGIDSFGKLEVPANPPALILTDQERNVEKLVESVARSFDEGSTYEINNKNIHKRDSRIKFNSDEHAYYIDGVRARSVTEIIESFFPQFDADSAASRIASREGSSKEAILNKWKADNDQAAILGTKLHSDIEAFYHTNSKCSTVDFKEFLRFVADHPSITPYRSEWRIFDESTLTAGTIDMLVANDQGSYDLYDWKRSKKLVNPATGNIMNVDTYGLTGLGVFRNLSNTSYTRYCIQQNVYRFVLKKNYGIEIKNMYLVVIHPTLEKYFKLRVDIDNESVTKIFQTDY